MITIIILVRISRFTIPNLTLKNNSPLFLFFCYNSLCPTEDSQVLQNRIKHLAEEKTKFLI